VGFFFLLHVNLIIIIIIIGLSAGSLKPNYQRVLQNLVLFIYHINLPFGH